SRRWPFGQLPETAQPTNNAPGGRATRLSASTRWCACTGNHRRRAGTRVQMAAGRRLRRRPVLRSQRLPDHHAPARGTRGAWTYLAGRLLPPSRLQVAPGAVHAPARLPRDRRRPRRVHGMVPTAERACCVLLRDEPRGGDRLGNRRTRPSPLVTGCGGAVLLRVASAL